MNLIPTVRLIRVEESNQGTFGVLVICSQAFCVCLEPPSLLNKREESCIPYGQYLCKRVVSPRYGITFEITNVPNRTHILFHTGNFKADTTGCILLGQSFDKLKGNRGILNSRLTFKRFMAILKNTDTFHLTITPSH